MLHIDQNVLDDISQGFSVPAQPKLLLKLLKLMAEPNPDVNAIADCISKDIAISAAILKTINSPIYGLSRSITDIKMSVNYIGVYGVVTLVTGSLLKKSFDPKSCHIDLNSFWNMTEKTSNVIVTLGKKYKPDIATDKLASLGLFHDCGIPVMAMKYKKYQQVVDQALTTPELSLTQAEEKAFQVNHATLGYYVANSWRLPKGICQIILQHHERDYLSKLDNSIEQDLFALLKLAEHIISLKYSKNGSTDWAYIETAVLTIFNINKAELASDIAEVVESL
jgi:HD-like signal output (HDOD) protein